MKGRADLGAGEGSAALGEAWSIKERERPHSSFHQIIDFCTCTCTYTALYLAPLFTPATQKLLPAQFFSALDPAPDPPPYPSYTYHHFRSSFKTKKASGSTMALDNLLQSRDHSLTPPHPDHHQKKKKKKRRNGKGARRKDSATRRG